MCVWDCPHYGTCHLSSSLTVCISTCLSLLIKRSHSSTCQVCPTQLGHLCATNCQCVCSEDRDTVIKCTSEGGCDDTYLTCCSTCGQLDCLCSAITSLWSELQFYWDITLLERTIRNNKNNNNNVNIILHRII